MKTRNLSPIATAEGTGKASSSSLKIKNILVPTDFSEASRPASMYADQWAEALHAAITLVHVAPLMVGGRFIYAVDPFKRTERHLEQFRKEQFSSDITVKSVVRSGTPYQEINNLAKKMKASLIVIATHGYTGLKHVFLGSTAERIIRHATCPVLAVRSYSKKTSSPKAFQLKRILVPVDFSKTSLKALHYALSLARSFKASIHLIHVVEPPLYPPNLGEPNMELFIKDLQKGAQKELMALEKKPFFDPKLISSTQIRTGDAFQEILRASKDQKSDLIVLSTHGYTGLKHLLIGSTAEKVVCHAECPVLALRGM